MSAISILRWFAALLVLAAVAAQAAPPAPVTTWFHNDLAGSPVAATNAAGQVIWREGYYPFGERLLGPVTDNRVWFTSRRQDPETGLVYMGARYYDPVAGRFLQPDPVHFVESNVHSFNRYAYANNNPYRYKDPTGTVAESLWDLASFALSVGIFRNDPSLGNFAGAAVDGIALAVPFVPGGVGTIRSIGRAAEDVGATGAKSVEQMASELSSRLGKNSVEFTTVTQKGHIDLAGRSHFDKATGTVIPTPHVQAQDISLGPQGQFNLGSETTRAATKQDIRVAREIERRRQ